MYCMLLYVFDMFHILLSGDSLRDLWNAYMYVCICMYKVVSKSERRRRRWECELDSGGLGVGPEVDCCESGNEPPLPSEVDNFLTSYAAIRF